MDYICNDDLITHIVHRQIPLMTHCNQRYDPTDYVDFEHRCADSHCIGNVYEYPVEEVDSGSLGDTLYLTRKGHYVAYELKEEEEPTEEEEEPETEEMESQSTWSNMTDEEIRKAERKRVNRR